MSCRSCGSPRDLRFRSMGCRNCSERLAVSVGMVVLLLLVRQAMVFAKVWSRLLFYSAQCALYHDLRRIPVPMEAAPLPQPEPAALLAPGLESLTESVTPPSRNKSRRRREPTASPAPPPRVDR